MVQRRVGREAQLSVVALTPSEPVTGTGRGPALAQFLAGATDEFGSYSGICLESRWPDELLGIFLQDDYRVTPNFPSTSGLRYDLMPYAFNHERHNLVANFNPDLMNPDVPLLGAVEYSDTTQYHEAINSDHKNHFASRFSFAWTPLQIAKLLSGEGSA